MASRKFFSQHNGHSSNHQGQQYSNGLTNGFDDEQKVVIPEMCFFCFDILHKELNGCCGQEQHVEPHNLGISNNAL